MSTITLISQTIDILYTGCLYGLISFVGIKLVTQIPTWWAQSDPRKQAAADTLPAPTHQTEVTDVKTPEVIAEIEVNKKPQTLAAVEVVEETQTSVAEIEISEKSQAHLEVEVNEEPQAQKETPAPTRLNVLALKIYKLHNFQVVKVEAVEAQGVSIPDSIKRYAYRKIPQAVIRLKDLESIGLVSHI